MATAGVIGGRRLVHKDGTLLTWFDATTGARIGTAVTAPHGTLALVGSSADGQRAVLARTERRRTTFLVVSPDHPERQVVLGGRNWSFDALAGERLYLLHWLPAGYQVRLYNLAENRLDPAPLKDPHEPALIQGAAWERLASPDGRYLFTLYLNADGGAMIHELDLRTGSARCVDLPGNGNFNAAGAYALALSPDQQTLWALSPGYGQVAAIDVQGHRLRQRFEFTAGAWTGNAGIAAIAADGQQVAVTDAQHLWLVDLPDKRVTHLRSHVAIALAFSTNGRKLWMIGERSHVASLPIP